MCSGIEYDGQLLVWKDPEVALPVLLRDGSIAYVRWGERHGVVSPFYQGPCARLESIQAGKWRKFNPQPVQIPLTKYMERDAKGKPYWVSVADGEVLQGMIASWAGEQRVYVVTVESPAEFAHIQPRWPRVIPARKR